MSKEHFPREKPPNLQALLKNSSTQPQEGWGTPSPYLPKRKPSLSCLINRKYLLARRRERRGGEPPGRELALFFLGVPQLLASLGFRVPGIDSANLDWCPLLKASGLDWGSGSSFPLLLSRIDCDGSSFHPEGLHSWLDWLGEGYRFGGLSVYEIPFSLCWFLLREPMGRVWSGGGWGGG